MLKNFYNDEAGFIVSAELVLIATIVVIGLIVGLSEIQHSIVNELNDVADAIGELDQSYCTFGFSAEKSGGGNGVKSFTVGIDFIDYEDDCDHNQCSLECDPPQDESPKI